MLTPPIPLPEWMPDAIDMNSNGLVEATNVLPHVDGYGPFKSLTEVSDSLGAECIGAKSFLSSGGTIYTFAGTTTHLYQYDSGTGGWTDVTRTSGGNYTSVAGDFWDFIAYGDLVIATNYSDAPQCFFMGVDTDFSLLSSTAPRCRKLWIIGEFVFMGDTVDTIDGIVGNRIWWSPIGNPQGVWASSQTTQCDFQDLAQDSSPVVAGAGSQNIGLVMKGISLHRIQYVGPPLVFSIELIEQERGSKLSQSVIGDGVGLYYISEDGFYYFNGSMSIPIGQGKVDQYFKTNLDSNYSNRVQSAIDPVNKLVAWAFPGPGNTGGRPNFILIYSWAFTRWILVEQEVECLLRSFNEGNVTLESLDAIYASLESIPFSLDSLVWKASSSIFAAFSANHKLGPFAGANMDGVITTAEQALNDQGKAYVHSIEPLIDYEDDVTVALGYRGRQKDTVSWTPEASVFDETGVANFDVDAKYHRARFTLSGNNWSRIKGFKVGYEATGDV